MRLSSKVNERVGIFSSIRCVVDAVSYRIALPVREISVCGNDDSFPICPRCDQTMDREYMAFCDCCGQKINWQTLPMAKIRGRQFKLF